MASMGISASMDEFFSSYNSLCDYACLVLSKQTSKYFSGKKFGVGSRASLSKGSFKWLVRTVSPT